MRHTFVIAEPGCTHEGNLRALLGLVEMAAECGADVFKAQWTSDAARLAQRRRAPDLLPCYQWLQFDPGWHAVLAARCAEYGLQYACTVYLPEDVAIIDPYVACYKIAAFESQAQDLRDAYSLRMSMKRNTKDLIVSLGMGATFPYKLFPEILWPRVRPLRCVSAYPSKHEELHLATIRGQALAGLSDHTADQIMIGALAVAAGAQIVERHIKLESCRVQNPDAPAALGVHAFTAYVRAIRYAEQCLGDADAGLQPGEQPMLAYRVSV